MDGTDGCSFFVAGDPVPKGSWDTFWNKYIKRCVLVARNSKAAEAWRKAVWAEARRARVPRLMSGPVQVRIIFWLPRAVKISALWRYRDLVPDGDKLERLVLDALTGTAWKDDRQVCDLHWTKRYVEDGKSTGAAFTITPLEQSETLF